MVAPLTALFIPAFSCMAGCALRCDPGTQHDRARMRAAWTSMERRHLLDTRAFYIRRKTTKTRGGVRAIPLKRNAVSALAELSLGETLKGYVTNRVTIRNHTYSGRL